VLAKKLAFSLKFVVVNAMKSQQHCVSVPLLPL
jgi:hypothetical protein